MNSIKSIIRNIRNILPYLLLIVTYFFFINLEATKDRKKQTNIEEKSNLNRNKLKEDNNQRRIKIPVIPYKE